MPDPLNSFLKHQRLLVLSPHADDETAGAGGLIARVKAAGGEVYVMVTSVGNLAHFDATGRKTKGKTRREELGEAMKVLGVDDWEILIHDDDLHLRIDTIPRRDLVELIERKGRLATEKTRPTMICLPAPSFNQDHEAVYNAGLTACRPHLAAMKAFQRAVLVMDAPQVSWSKDHFHPTFYVDISGPFLKRKLEAFACHKSQLRPDPSQGGLNAIRLLAEWRGREISVKAAEAFECARFVM